MKWVRMQLIINNPSRFFPKNTPAILLPKHPPVNRDHSSRSWSRGSRGPPLDPTARQARPLPPTDGPDLRHVSRARGRLFRCNKPGQAPAAVGSRGGATWTPREGGTGRWGGAAWCLTGSSRWRSSPGWRGRKRSEVQGGVGGFKKGVGFEGFWPTQTIAPRTSTTRRKNQGGGRRGEQGGRRGKREGNKNKRGEAKQGEEEEEGAPQRQGRGE